MQKKSIPFVQNCYHDIEDEDRAAEYLEDALPILGEVVMSATAVERLIGFLICEMPCDRTESPGRIVTQKLMFSGKLDLFKRLISIIRIRLSS